MSAWEIPTDPDYGDQWDRFDKQFKFRASYPPNGPGIREPNPSVTFDIAAPIDGPIPEEEYGLVNELHTKAHAAFQRVTPIGKRLIVLDWQHEDWLFDPHAPFDPANWRNWETWVYPDGDYYVFLADDFSFGTFAHPWAQTICVWGQDLIDAFASDPPLLFQRAIRRNGLNVP